MTVVVAVAAGLCGLGIGSFLGVVIHRVPLRLPVFGAPPACSACGARLSGRDRLDRLVLPKRIVYPTGVLVSAGLIAAAASAGAWHRLAVAVACGAVACGLFLVVHVASPKAMGFGDVRLAPLISGTLGWFGVHYAVVGFVLANLLGAVTGPALIAAGRRSRRSPLPYGVFLALGAVLALPLGTLVGSPL
ncbi:MAG: prepilin peptidase [Actinomycetota bacterium]|nr:prepilin peptidase [Actinomycetota bacterium]